MTDKILWYFADPMCSWCWGFSPVIHQIKTTFDDRVKIALVLGGLRPGTTDPMSDDSRKEILHHWHEVEKMSGASFNFDNALPEQFIYDTEPASRAVITAATLQPDRLLPYFTAVQSAFYVEQKDVTQQNVLATIAAEEFNLDRDRFIEEFESDAMRTKTQQHFELARKAGVRGFPCMKLQTDEKQMVDITNGYQAGDKIIARLNSELGD